jgi:hypothetical protein
MSAEHGERVARVDAELGDDHAGRLVDAVADRPAFVGHAVSTEVADEGDPHGIGQELCLLSRHCDAAVMVLVDQDHPEDGGLR